MTGDTTDIPAEAQRRRKPRRILARFRRSQDGATAIEFAFVAAPFLMLLAAIIETAVMFWTSQVLEEAVNETARTLVTGQARAIFTGTNAANAAAFRDAVCANGPLLIDCTKVAVDVRTYASFAGAQTGTTGSNPIAGGVLNTSGFTFNQPAAGQIVVVRAVLEYTLFFTQWSSALANIGEGRRGLVASSTFRTEPFQ
jgi:Flp pilus assembly protein TadG